jgi:hypothetical protein
MEIRHEWCVVCGGDHRMGWTEGPCVNVLLVAWHFCQYHRM